MILVYIVFDIKETKRKKAHEKPYDIKNNLNSLTCIGDEQIVRQTAKV